MAYRVRNWRQFQHYKDRNPPWIKLHFAMLSSADWVTLDDASRVLAIACMLVASRNEGEIPDDPAYLKRVAYLNRTPNFKPLINCGFLEDASGCKQMLADARPETETETETETPLSGLPDQFARFWESWPSSGRKVAKAKCAKVWRSRKLDPLVDSILAHIEAMRDSEQWTTGFEPAPLTYLNQRRWEDGVPTMAARPSLPI